MATYLAPGVFVEEKSSGNKPIEAVSTSIAAFIGVASMGPIGRATLITSAAEFARVFGGPMQPDATIPALLPHLAYAVQHFFAERGTTCYVVRTAHYDVANPSVVTATRAYQDFNAKDAAGTVVAGALRVLGKTEGAWGKHLKVQVLNSSKYMVRLAQSTTATDTSISLVVNEDVKVGDLLWGFEAVSGIVDAVNSATNTIALRADSVTSGGTTYTGSITTGMTVITPDFALIQKTNLAAPINVVAGAQTAGIILGAVTRDDTGASLQPGDVVTFAAATPILLVVTKTSPTVVAGAPAMRIDYAPQVLPVLDKAKTMIFARDFKLRVRAGDVPDILETHEHLSLVDADRADHVDERLPFDGGPSRFIAALDRVTADAILLDNTTFTALGNAGADGLTGLTDADYLGTEAVHSGVHALDLAKDASILCIPGAAAALASQAIAYCELRKGLFFNVDPPPDPLAPDIVTYRNTAPMPASSYAALYYPRIKVPEQGTGKLISVPPSGAIAGVYAATDGARGVHKAPAGLDATLGVASALAREVTRAQNDVYYQDQINVIRKMPFGIVVWGARTLDAAADPEWKYVNVRRLFIMLERSIELGTQWVTFEPNDSTLWKSITRNVRAFLKIQWLEGKLVGATEDQAFFVKCDASTNPPEIVEAGQVITEIGVAPSKPAEFVVFRIRQMAGGSRT